MPPAALPQPPLLVALRTGDAGPLASAAPPPLQSIQARLTLNPPSNPPPQLEPRWFFPNPHHHVPQVCICMFSLLVLMHTSRLLTGSSLISSQGPSHQSSANSSLVSLYPTLGYRTLMQDMSPTAFGAALYALVEMFVDL